VKKKTTPFGFARAGEASRSAECAGPRSHGYPSFREAIATSDLRALVQRAARRVLGPAALAGAVLGGAACDRATEVYVDLIAPVEPEIDRPVRMSEVPPPIAEPTVPSTTTPEAIPPCDIEEVATEPKVRVGSRVTHHPRLPGRPAQPNPRAQVRGEMTAVRP
jgi:hypothetical protein